VASKNIFRISITIVLLLVLAAIIFYPKLKPMLSPEQGGGPQPGMRAMGGGQQPLFASGYVLVPTKMDELIYSTGSLLPDEEVDLAFETSGKVVGIYFEEGRKVSKGELLAKINDRPLQAQLLKLQAQRKLVEEREFRQRQLLDRDAISRESYDQVATELQSIEADLMLIQARIAETELRAPFDGIVGLRMISEGAFATTQTNIVRLVKTRPLKIEFSVPERYAGEVVPGFPITFQIDGIPESFQANVYAIDPKVDINTRTIVVRALYPNTNEELKPGRFASVRARLSQIENAVSIPTEALIPEMEGEKVYIVSNGKAQERKVTTGLRTESHIQIRTGLNFGDTLLTTAILQLRNDLPVQLDTLVTNHHLVNEIQ
jgi:membrane fusion protein, multidrug efflux system